MLLLKLGVFFFGYKAHYLVSCHVVIHAPRYKRSNVFYRDSCTYFHVAPNVNRYDTSPCTIQIDLVQWQIALFVVQMPVLEPFRGPVSIYIFEYEI